MLVDGHVHALAFELHSFHFQAKALLVGGSLVELYFASGAENALPGQACVVVAEKFRHKAMIERIARGGGDLSVGGDLAFRDGADDAADGGVALLVGTEAVLDDAAFEFVIGRWG